MAQNQTGNVVSTYRLKASTDEQELWREVGQTRRNEQRDLIRKRSLSGQPVDKLIKGNIPIFSLLVLAQA